MSHDDIKSKLTTALFLLASVAIAGSAAPGTEPREALANHALKSLDGAETTLASFRGEVVVVNFWASWCAPCRKELPVMDAWHTAWAGRGARVVAISVDNEVRKARRFAEQADLSLTILHDGPSGLAKTLDLPSLPCTYLIDRDGNVVSVVRSSSQKDLESIQQSVESMLASTQRSGVTMKTTVRLCCLILLLTAAVGCSSVRPYQKEHLADPIMLLSLEDELREQKWMEAREGSTGGAGGAGGGCACR